MRTVKTYSTTTKMKRLSAATAMSLLVLGSSHAHAAEPAKGDKGAAKPAASEDAPAKSETPAPKKASTASVSPDRAAYEAAVKKWEETKEKDPKKAVALTASNCKSYANKFLDAANSKTYGADAHYSAGAVYDACGMHKEAATEYQAALAANPNHARALNNIGEAMFKKGDRAGAKAQFEKAIAADPTHASSAYNNLGMLLFLEGKEKGQPALYKDAIAKLRRGLAIDSESAPAYAMLALIYYTTAEGDKSKLQLAELIVKQAKLTNDKYAPIYNTMGLINLKRKNVSNALREFEKAVELDPNFIEAHLNIGAIGLSARQYEKAQASFEAVLKLQPNNFDATMGLGVAMRGQKKLEDAEKFYKKAGEIDPKSCAPAFNLGLLHHDYSYKVDAANSQLKTAQQFFNQFASCSKEKARVDEAKRRVKDIDDTFKAIEEQKKIEEENKKMMEEMERMQKAQQAQQAAQQPADAKPADAKPADAKPADAKPADAKPAEKK